MTAELVLWIAGGVFVAVALGALVIALVVGSQVEHALRDWWR